MKPKLEDAIRLAVQAHRSQRDRVGQPYILHPLRVMFRLRTEAEKITGVLHDIIEHTGYTLNDLRRMGYPKRILNALNGVSRREGESYEDFVLRTKKNPISRKVKLADLEDNMDPDRMTKLTKKDLARLARYRKAWLVLRQDKK
jgi:(p)ppGpp synthase/HD superfamily hydrolase